MDEAKKFLRDPELNLFHVRNSLMDFNKSVFSYLFVDKLSDYIILDTGCLRFPLYLWERHNLGFTNIVLERFTDKIIPSLDRYQLFKSDQLSDDKFKNCMDNFLRNILMRYRSESIILIEVHWVEFYLSKTGNVYPFTNQDTSCERSILRGYEYLHNRLPDCHVIPFLRGIIGDEDHKWGRHPLHYIPEYYQYGYEALKIISEHRSLEEERELIACLKAKWEKKIASKYPSSVHWKGNRHHIFSMREYLDTARVDIKNHGTLDNDIKISVLSGGIYRIINPEWFSKDGIGYVMELKEHYIKVKIICISDGTLHIDLKGIDRRTSKGDFITFWIDYTGMTVNGEKVFSNVVPAWHNEPFQYSREVMDGEVLFLEISWKPHLYVGVDILNMLLAMEEEL